MLSIEVELENGTVRPCGTDTLPAKARGILTIVEAAQPELPKENRTWAEHLQHLCGIGNGQYSDLSTNKDHMKDFGK